MDVMNEAANYEGAEIISRLSRPVLFAAVQGVRDT